MVAPLQNPFKLMEIGEWRLLFVFRLGLDFSFQWLGLWVLFDFDTPSKDICV